MGARRRWTPKTSSLPNMPQNSQRLILFPNHGHTSCSCFVQHSWWLLVLDVWSGRPLGTSNLGYNRGSIHFPDTETPAGGLCIYFFVYLLLIKMSQRYPAPSGLLLARATLMPTPHLGFVPHISIPRCRIRACLKEKGNCCHFPFSIDGFFSAQDCC